MNNLLLILIFKNFSNANILHVQHAALFDLARATLSNDDIYKCFIRLP
jgi:hypothetical protein